MVAVQLCNDCSSFPCFAAGVTGVTFRLAGCLVQDFPAFGSLGILLEQLVRGDSVLFRNLLFSLPSRLGGFRFNFQFKCPGLLRKF